MHVAKPFFLLVKYCMLLTHRSWKDSCTAASKLHVTDTMQNIAFALFTLHVAHNLSSFLYYFQIICDLTFAFSKNCMWLTPCKVFSLSFCSLHVACIWTNLLLWFSIACGSHITESVFYYFYIVYGLILLKPYNGINYKYMWFFPFYLRFD